MTLRELKAKVRPTEGIELPSAKSLLKSDIPVVVREKGDSYQITVFENGFAVYQSDRYLTVFRIDECRDYTYRFCDGEESYCGEKVFLDSPFSVLLVLLAEDRLEHNQIRRDHEKGKIQFMDQSEIAELPDQKEDFVTAMENRDMCQLAMSCLTSSQRRLINLYFYEEYTMEEIAKEYKTSRQNISRKLDVILNKMRTFVEEH